MKGGNPKRRRPHLTAGGTGVLRRHAKATVLAVVPARFTRSGGVRAAAARGVATARGPRPRGAALP
jgi:hypothetical protein